jgi:DNA polymerase III sliding clamp (beta) subunit (PCNA family)
MNVSIKVTELKNAIDGLSKITSARTKLPILSAVKVERKNNRTEMSATDPDRMVFVKLDSADEGEDGVFVTDLVNLKDCIKGCGKNDVIRFNAEKEVKIKKDGKEDVTYKRLIARVVGDGMAIEKSYFVYDPVEFPLFFEVDTPEFEFSEELKCSMFKAFECVSEDATRYILNGAYFDIGEDAKKKEVVVVGTNGYHLYRSAVFPSEMKHSMIVPNHKFMGWKSFVKDGAWRMSQKIQKPAEKGNEEYLYFQITSDHWRFVSKLISGIYPNYRCVIPDWEKAGVDTFKIAIDPSRLDAALNLIERMPMRSKDTRKYGGNFEIKLIVHESELHFSSNGDDSDKATEVLVDGAKIAHIPNKPTFPAEPGELELPPKQKELPFATSMNRKLLSKALRFGLVNIEIEGDMSPLIFSNAGEIMVAMPCRAS